MSRSRWVVVKGEGLVPANEYYAREHAKKHGEASYFMPDIAEFVSPIDGKAIGSRSALRDHERKHGVRQCGELKSAAEFDNSASRTEITQRSEKAMDRAYGAALQRLGL